jgi:putative transposase
MIDEAIIELTPLLGVRAACPATGQPRANHYRRHRKSTAPPRPTRALRPRPRALSVGERDEVRAVLNSPEHVVKAPATVYNELLDHGVYLAPMSTMYRVLRAVHERRRQATHSARVKTELVATRPNMYWSWDITKLLGPAKWTYYYLYEPPRSCRHTTARSRGDRATADTFGRSHAAHVASSAAAAR